MKQKGALEIPAGDAGPRGGWRNVEVGSQQSRTALRYAAVAISAAVSALTYFSGSWPMNSSVASFAYGTRACGDVQQLGVNDNSENYSDAQLAATPLATPHSVGSPRCWIDTISSSHRTAQVAQRVLLRPSSSAVSQRASPRERCLTPPGRSGSTQSTAKLLR